MTKIQHDRLQQLSLFIRDLPPKKLMMRRVISEMDERNCGTVCCAIGWTPVVFPDLVRWYISPEGVHSSSVELIGGEDEYHDYVGIAEYLFGTFGHEAVDLFGTHIPPDPQSVADKIDEFLLERMRAGLE